MASEWKIVTIEEVTEKVAMGPFGSSIKVATFVQKGIPVISGQHLHGTRLLDKDNNFITPEHAEKLRNANVFRGDIILTHAGNIGQVVYIPDDSQYNRYVISQRQFYARCDRSKVLPELIVYYFKSPEGQHKLLANTSSTGVPSISRPVTYFRTIEIPLPPIHEQKAIAHILGTLDDKIELNRKMNETLETIARVIFKSWFVDFDPVRAKVEGRQPAGIDSETAALFPDSFEDSELGKIPKKWRAGKLGEDFSLTMGQSPKGSTYNKAGIGLPFYQGRKDFGFRYPSVRVYCTEPTRIAEKGDTLVSVRAPVGDINMAATKCCIGRGVSAVRHKSNSISYTYYFMLSVQEYFARFEAEGTVFGSINKQQFLDIPTLYPSDAIVDAFDTLISPFDQKIESLTKEIYSLDASRDTLLPKLLSGEMRIKNAENIIKGVA